MKNSKYNLKSGGSSEGIREEARTLRRAMTSQERKLWSAVRNRLLAGIKVRRQFPTDRFILDFYIPARRLAIEIDGGAHSLNVHRDNERTAALTAYDIRIIRFTNDEVDHDLSGVLDKIQSAAIVEGDCYANGITS